MSNKELIDRLLAIRDKLDAAEYYINHNTYVILDIEDLIKDLENESP